MKDQMPLRGTFEWEKREKNIYRASALNVEASIKTNKTRASQNRRQSDGPASITLSAANESASFF